MINPNDVFKNLKGRENPNNEIFSSLEDEIQKGLQGANEGIPIGFPRLEQYASIRKKQYYLIGGYTGSAKSTFIQDAFILNPIDFIIKNPGTFKVKIFLRSMERSKTFMYAKWLSRRIFLDHGIIIPLWKMLGWSHNVKLTLNEQNLIQEYKVYFQELAEYVKVIDGAENPVGVSKDFVAYLKSVGKIEDVDEFNKIYIPDDPKLINVHITDHVGLLKHTKDLNTNKASIDKWSGEAAYIRDFYGCCMIDVQQFNRDIVNPIRLKQGDVSPNLEDFKDTSSTQHNADLVLGLFDPGRYKVEALTGHDLSKLQSPEDGAKLYRSLHILKSTYSTDGVVLPLAFQPHVGVLKELPKKKDMTEAIYNEVLSFDYFKQLKKGFVPKF